MTVRRPLILLVASVAALAGAAVMWASTSRNDGRADLVGPAVVTSSTTSTTMAASSTVADAGLSPAVRPAVAPEALLPATPVAISIPSIGVDSPVVPVALTPERDMEIPGATEAGWFALGPRPGSRNGSAVIAAHVDFDGVPGVFLRLDRLAVGAQVVVRDSGGTPHVFTVDERFQVDKDALPRSELFRTGGPPTLTLITCGGAFDSSARHYEDNIVVRAVPR